jgi:hypothetical protein
MYNQNTSGVKRESSLYIGLYLLPFLLMTMKTFWKVLFWLTVSEGLVHDHLAPCFLVSTEAVQSWWWEQNAECVHYSQEAETGWD